MLTPSYNHTPESFCHDPIPNPKPETATNPKDLKGKLSPVPVAHK